jgi:GxxExxY protein
VLLAEQLTETVIGLAIEVHRHTGPGLLESVYEQCLCHELAQAGISFARQVAIPITYKGAPIGDGFKADVVVAHELILEIKAVAAILPVHEVQLRTYLRISRTVLVCY